MISEFFRLAFGNLRHRGLRSWLTILGIFIGIAAVVSLISLGSGLREAVTGQFGAVNSDTLTIQNKGTGFGPPGSTVVEKLNEHDLKIIEKINGIRIIIPRLLKVAKVEYNDVSSFKYITTVPLEQEQIDEMYSVLDMKASEGKLMETGETGGILLGSDVIKNSEEEFGKTISLGKTIKFNGKEFKVTGILEKMSSFQLNGIFFMAQEDLESLEGVKGEYDIFAVRVENKNNIEQVASEIERKLRDDRNEKLGEESFSVETPLQALSAVNTILNIINLIVIGIAMISLFVGGVGIANTMYTSILERTKEIGVMKAIGAKNFDILWIFLIESGLLGLVGGIVGALVGLGGAFGVAQIANNALGEDLFRIRLNYMLLGGSILFSFIVGIISGTLPAFQASKLKVVEALRK